ncbi:MAG: entericidin A/B family lipoprotein [Pseudomonadota bacterium]
MTRIAAPLLLLIALAACNTAAGVGKDVEGAGKAISGAADDTKRAIEDDNGNDY